MVLSQDEPYSNVFLYKSKEEVDAGQIYLFLVKFVLLKKLYLLIQTSD